MAKPFYSFPVLTVQGRFGNGIYKMRDSGPFLDHYSLLPEKREDPYYTPRKCSCQAFKYLDLQYQGFSDEEKTKWRRAVKKPGLSGYTLFMSEGLYLLTKGKCFSGEPSISGGYNAKKAIEGYKYFPPEACIFRNPDQACMEAAAQIADWYWNDWNQWHRDKWNDDVRNSRFTGYTLMVWEWQWCMLQGFSGPAWSCSRGGTLTPDPCLHPFKDPVYP